MLSSRNILLVSGILVFFAGLGVFLTTETSTERPPQVPNHSQASPVAQAASFPDTWVLTGPWVQAPPPPPVKPLPPPAVVPPPPKAPDPVDKKSLTFLGSYKDQDGSPAYFFKFLPTGAVVILKPGQTSKGWQLVEIQEHLFALTGPGGRFEVSH